MHVSFTFGKCYGFYRFSLFFFVFVFFLKKHEQTGDVDHTSEERNIDAEMGHALTIWFSYILKVMGRHWNFAALQHYRGLESSSYFKLYSSITSPHCLYEPVFFDNLCEKKSFLASRPSVEAGYILPKQHSQTFFFTSHQLFMSFV